MALIKRKTRKKLAKQLRKLVKRHGPETTLALVSGIVSSLSASSGVPRPTRRKAPVRSVPVRKRRATSAAASRHSGRG